MSEGLVGVIIGGVIGIIGGIISQYIQIHNKRKNDLIAKKEQTYLKAIDIITRFQAEVQVFPGMNNIKIPRDLKVELNGIKPNMTIYSTDKIYDYFIKIIGEITSQSFPEEERDDYNINEMIENFSKMILKDLKY